MEDIEKIEKIVRHIRNVQENCEVLGKKLIERGEVSLGKQLIANGLVHDNSKLFGIEWEYLDDSAHKDKQEMAIRQHNMTNFHHPEAWSGGVKGMPKLFLAEMVCDVCARASEFGTNVREWIDNSATKKYGFTKRDKVYKEIQKFLNLLLDKPF